jgi:hypothetical protein
MNLYTFELESFHINNTRSRHDDTDTVTFGLQVGDQQFPIQSHYAGNLNNGDYPVNLLFGPILITEDAVTAVFTYEIYNGGAGGLPTSLVTLNQALLNNVVPLVVQTSGLENGGWPNFSSGEAGADVPNPDNPFDDTSDWSTLFFGAIAADIGSFLFPDCDGFVAADGIGMSKEQWDQAIDSVGGETFRKTMHYAGSNSPAGCGSNSDYTVTWSVTRETMRGSVRQFLKAHGLNLHPGLRSLTKP